MKFEMVSFNYFFLTNADMVKTAGNLNISLENVACMCLHNSSSSVHLVKGGPGGGENFLFYFHSVCFSSNNMLLWYPPFG